MRHLLCGVLVALTARADPLRIALYDRAHLPKSIIRMTSDRLKSIFRESKIEIRLDAGDAAVEEASLFVYAGSLKYNHETACRARRDIALQIAATAPRGVDDTILGMSQPLANSGLNVLVFAEHVRFVSVVWHLPYATILSYVIAHEVGHVLMRDATHSIWGLMASRWKEHEYRMMDRGLMFFTPEQSQSMRQALAGAGCANDEK